MDNNKIDTIIKQFSKDAGINYIPYFYSYTYSILNNLIDTNISKNLKFVLINYLMFERVIIFFKDNEDNLQVGRLAYCDTRDENFLPIDITARTIDGTRYNLIEGEYVMLYNPIPVDYLHMKLEEMSNIEKTIIYRRKLYKVPIIFKSKDSKILRNIKDFIKKIFSTDEVCTITTRGFNMNEDIDKINLDIEYITDKLLDENESIKEDILEIFGIYKNTSIKRERVNESELIINNSLTTVNKLGIEDTLNSLFKEIREVLGYNYDIELNINKIFDTMQSNNKIEEVSK